MGRLAIAVLATSTVLGSPGWASTLQTLFSDQTTDQVLYAKDLNGDGDTNDAGEINVFFDANNGSGLPSPSNSVFNLVQSRAGDVYAGDGETDTVYRLRDLDGDNTAQGAGEASVWFSAANASGLALQTANGVAEGPDGAIYIVQADTRGMPTQDAVYRTQDLNGDGDANDAGEASVWLDLTGLNAGSSPFEISFDGNVAYIADTAGGSPRVYRAEDLDGNGQVEASEVNEFVKSADFVFALSVEASQGDVYSYDFLDDALVRYSDLNGDQQVDMASERFTAFDAGAIVDGAVFDFAVQGDQALITVNSFDDDDLLLHLSDLNADGDFMDLGEVTTLLQFSDQGTYPQRPRSVIFYDSSAATPVPLPASILLLSGAVGGLILSGRRKKAA